MKKLFILHVDWSLIHSSEATESTYMSTYWWLEKEKVAYGHNKIWLYLKKQKWKTNPDIQKKMIATAKQSTKSNRLNQKRWILHFLRLATVNIQRAWMGPAL